MGYIELGADNPVVTDLCPDSRVRCGVCPFRSILYCSARKTLLGRGRGGCVWCGGPERVELVARKHFGAVVS